MFESNTALEQDNSYHQGVDDVFIAFHQMINITKDDNAYRILREAYGKLSRKFPPKECNTFEE